MEARPDSAIREAGWSGSGVSLGDVGETELVAELCATAGVGDLEIGPGDDAAAWIPAPGFEVITTDSLVEGVDFLRSTQSPYEVGLKAFSAAASDLAAMGARPRLVVTCLVCPGETDFRAVRAIQRGLVDAATLEGAVVAGGDVSSGTGPLMLAVTVVGSLPDGRPVRLGGAGPGDALLLTGTLGGAAAALAALRAGVPPRPEWKARLVTPRPRTREGSALMRGGASAMTDISDGLLVDAGRMAAASGARLVIWSDRLPLAPGLGGMPLPERLPLAVAGGEDFELLATVPGAALDGLLRSWDGPEPLSVIGEVTKGVGVRLLDREAGAEVKLEGGLGFRHF